MFFNLNFLIKNISLILSEPQQELLIKPIIGLQPKIKHRMFNNKKGTKLNDFELKFSIDYKFCKINNNEETILKNFNLKKTRIFLLKYKINLEKNNQLEFISLINLPKFKNRFCFFISELPTLLKGKNINIGSQIISIHTITDFEINTLEDLKSVFKEFYNLLGLNILTNNEIYRFKFKVEICKQNNNQYLDPIFTELFKVNINSNEDECVLSY